MYGNQTEIAIQYVELGGDPSGLNPASLAAILGNGALYHRLRTSDCDLQPAAFLEAVLATIM